MGHLIAIEGYAMLKETELTLLGRGSRNHNLRQRRWAGL